MRWMHMVHFSMTPFERTVTSGFSCQLSGSGNANVVFSGAEYSNQ